MAAPKTIRRKAGPVAEPGAVQVPLNWEDLLAAVQQLQATVNEVVVAFNAHKHATAADEPDVLVDGGGAADADLFTDAAAT